MDVNEVLDDLVAEQHALDEFVAPLTSAQWALPTPTPRWSVADQIGHLTVFDDVSFELRAPSGDTWPWGADAAAARVSGSAADFCLVVTQRRHIDDTALATIGDLARDWMTKAQAFAGGPTIGPQPAH